MTTVCLYALQILLQTFKDFWGSILTRQVNDFSEMVRLGSRFTLHQLVSSESRENPGVENRPSLLCLFVICLRRRACPFSACFARPEKTTKTIYSPCCETSSSSYLGRALKKVVRDERLSSKSQNAQSIFRLWSVLSHMLDSIPCVFCVIDGLDECCDSSDEISRFIDRFTGIIRGPRHK